MLFQSAWPGAPVVPMEEGRVSPLQLAKLGQPGQRARGLAEVVGMKKFFLSLPLFLVKLILDSDTCRVKNIAAKHTMFL